MRGILWCGKRSGRNIVVSAWTAMKGTITLYCSILSPTGINYLTLFSCSLLSFMSYIYSSELAVTFTCIILVNNNVTVFIILANADVFIILINATWYIILAKCYWAYNTSKCHLDYNTSKCYCFYNHTSKCYWAYNISKYYWLYNGSKWLAKWVANI